MRRIRYQVACSLDSYIAGPNGEIDWIVMDPDIDFNAIFAQFDTLLMGRRTFAELPAGSGGMFSGMNVVVVSRTLRQEDHPNVVVIADDIAPRVNELRAQPGKDIWLFGGGELFRSLLELGCVDTVEPAVIPVLLGAGRPLLPGPEIRRTLTLTQHRIYPKSGIVLLEYAVQAQAAKAKKSPRKRSARSS
jgi:dihydrofolate reductase